MAGAFVPTAKTFLSFHLTSSNPLRFPHSPPPASCSSSLFRPQKSNKRSPHFGAIRNPVAEESVPVCVTKRNFALSLTATIFISFARSGNGFSAANAAILEADDDEELLERVKKDRQKRIERQGVINSSKQETGYLQDLVYKLSEVGQDIDNNDLNAASSVLGPNTDTEWIKKATSAFTKLSSSPEQKAEVETFNYSIAKLISSVDQKDVQTSKMAFVSSASAFEKWTVLTGLVGQLKGL